MLQYILFIRKYFPNSFGLLGVRCLNQELGLLKIRAFVFPLTFMDNVLKTETIPS